MRFRDSSPFGSPRGRVDGSPLIESLAPPRAVRFEHTLPHLPVPTLQETADRYLTSIRPYHTAQEPSAPSDPLESWQTSEAAVKDFVNSPLVHKLQDRLQKRAESEGRESWLSEWWNETAYFGWRGPVVPGQSFLSSVPFFSASLRTLVGNRN